MSGVDDDGQPVEPVGQGREQVSDVARLAVGQGQHTAHLMSRRSYPVLAQATLDGILDGVVQFVSTPREELDAVVGHRVVRSGQDDPEVGIQLRREVGDRRGGEHAGVVDVDTGGGQTGDDRRRQELTGRPRITSDDGPRTVTGELSAVTEHVS